MPKVFVFCIGGTGIRVMKSITMLMAGGMDTNGYTVVPIILDPHLDLEEKKNLQSLITNYRDIYGKCNGSMEPLHGFFASKMETLDTLNQQSNDTKEAVGSQEKFGSYINRSALSTTDINNFLVETLFSSRNLESPLSVGFKGNPNVGTVVLGEMIEGADWFKTFKQSCEKGDRIFIISSIFGGTGASGYPLLEKKIKLSTETPVVSNAVMGAVTVLPYYALKDPSITSSDIDSTTFYTKTKAALAYYKDMVKADFLYYVGEKHLKQVYENDEKKQDDKAHFIEVVAASALFDFLQREKGEKQQFLSRAIEEDVDYLDLQSLGEGYKDIIKSVADFMYLRQLVRLLPVENQFPLKKNRGLDENFYNDSPFLSLQRFCDLYYKWYGELENNVRSFAPLSHDENQIDKSGWVKTIDLRARDDSYYLLEMIKASNRDKKPGHANKFRFFLDYAHQAIDLFTRKIEE